MTQRRTEVRAEIVRLAQGVDVYRAWKIDLFHRIHGPEAHLDLNTIVEAGSTFLANFDAHPGWPLKTVPDDLRAWYAHTAGELRHLLKSGEPATVDEISDFLKSFRTKAGFDFFSEAGMIASLARKVLKRGKLKSDDEWYILREVRDDLDQQVLSPDEAAAVSRLLADYEATQ